MTVVNEDILKLDIDQIAREHNAGKPIKVVANLPYYITTPIIMGLFESHVPLESVTVMVQKEVADRMERKTTGHCRSPYNIIQRRKLLRMFLRIVLCQDQMWGLP